MTTETNKAPGFTGLFIMAALLLAGAGSMLAMNPSVEAWPLAAAAGWALAGLLGMGAWLGARKAYQAGPHAFFKVIFGGMLLRMLVLGVAAGLVLGFDWLDTFGFVGGMGAGLIIFQVVEIAGISANAKKSGQGGTLDADVEVEHAR